MALTSDAEQLYQSKCCYGEPKKIFLDSAANQESMTGSEDLHLLLTT